MSDSLRLHIKNEVDLSKVYNFLGVNITDEWRKKISQQDEYNGVADVYIFPVMIYYFVEEDTDYNKMIKYDCDGLWRSSIITSYNNRYDSLIRGLISLILAKYIYDNFQYPICSADDVCSADDDKADFIFFYGREGLILPKKSGFFSKYPFPEKVRYEFSHLPICASHIECEKSKKIAATEYVIHFSSDVDIDFLLMCYFSHCRNYKHKDLAQLPPVDEKILDAFFIGPIKIIIEKSSWSYNLPISEKPIVTMTFTYPPEWKDIVIWSLINIYKYLKNGKGHYIVTTGDGDMIFSAKNCDYIIDKNWEKYFSKYPICVNNYIIDEDLKMLNQ